MKSNQKCLNIYTIRKFNFCVCMFKMDISAETWNNTGVSVFKIHEDDDVNNTLLLLFCNSDINKRLGCMNICNLIDKERKVWC